MNGRQFDDTQQQQQQQQQHHHQQQLQRDKCHSNVKYIIRGDRPESKTDGWGCEVKDTFVASKSASVSTSLRILKSKKIGGRKEGTVG